jgi:Ycf66 protein N-terminus
VAFGIPAALLFGLILILASLGLFLTSKIKPDLYQESDNIYAVIGIVCGLLLLISLDLGAAMAFQQLLMIGALISIMWQFMQVRAENKRLKGGGRSNGREAPARRSSNGYNARLDDEQEYVPQKRNRRSENGRADRQFQPSGYDDSYEAPERRGDRMLPGYARDEQMPAPRQRNDQNDFDRYEERATNGRSDRSRRAENPPDDDWSAPAENRGDWDNSPRPRQTEKPRNSPPRNKPRRSSLEDSADEPAAKSTAYVDYEPVEPSAATGKPIEFPDQY